MDSLPVGKLRSNDRYVHEQRGGLRLRRPITPAWGWPWTVSCSCPPPGNRLATGFPSTNSNQPVRRTGLLRLQLFDSIRVNDRRAAIGLAGRTILAPGQEGTNRFPFLGDVEMTARSGYDTARSVFLEPPAACVDDVSLRDPASFFDVLNFDFQEVVGFQRALPVAGRLDFPAVDGFDHSRHDMGGFSFELFRRQGHTFGPDHCH